MPYGKREVTLRGFVLPDGRGDEEDDIQNWRRVDELLSNFLIGCAANVDTLIVGTITRDYKGAAISANVVWPDGATGVYAATATSMKFPGAVDAYSVTHVDVNGTKTIMQPLVTRNVNGSVITKPAMIVS